MAQTSLSEAKAANKEFQEQGQHMRKMIRPAVNEVDGRLSFRPCFDVANQTCN